MDNRHFAPKAPPGSGVPDSPVLFPSKLLGVRTLLRDGSLSNATNSASASPFSSNLNPEFHEGREDSMVLSSRTVSEIDALLGNDFKRHAEELTPEAPVLDAAELEALSGQLSFALNRQLTFKDRLRTSLQRRAHDSFRREDSPHRRQELSEQPTLDQVQSIDEVPATPTLVSESLKDEQLERTHVLDKIESNDRIEKKERADSLKLDNREKEKTVTIFENDSSNLGSPFAAPTSIPFEIPAVSALKRSFKPVIIVGSENLDHGIWDSQGQWLHKEKSEVVVPAQLQQIKADDLVKVRELGRGCFGTVWLVKWRGVETALKEMLEVSAKDMASEQVFSEAERLAGLRHPCVIVMYGIVNTPGSYATVIEYMRMGSLRGALQRMKKQALSRGDVVFLGNRRFKAAVAVQAARGMEYLHSQFVVHFDLKCDNLLCDLRDLLRPVVKIGDLGLSKKKKETFISGNMRGTLPWMAPELFPCVREAVETEAGDYQEDRVNEKTHVKARPPPRHPTRYRPPAGENVPFGRKDKFNLWWDDRVNEKVDVFSFGVVLWEIWTLGEQPYPHHNLSEIFAGIMNGTLRPEIPDDCDPDWVKLMEACWQGEPHLRPSFSEIAERLDDMVEAWTVGSELVASRSPSFR